MTPRLNTSKTWTDLPTEFVSKVKTVFDNEFKLETSRGEFVVDGRIYPEELIVRIGYLENGRLKQVNFEASMDRPRPKSEDPANAGDKASTLDRLYSCIDALGSVMDEYFELDDKEEIDIPTRWRAFEFEGETVYLQHSTVNTRLEEEADRILGLADKSLVHEEELSEDALANAEIDAELAEEVQRLIREGKHPLQQQDEH